MFEELEQEEREEKESRKRLMRDSALVIGALVVLGALAYVIWRPSAKPAPNPPSTAQTVPADPPSATRDLEIVKAVMGKDVSGIRVMWSVKIRNKSTRYTYSNIKYEASFVGPDGRTHSGARLVQVSNNPYASWKAVKTQPIWMIDRPRSVLMAGASVPIATRSR